VFYLDVYTSKPSTLVPTADDDQPRDALTNELLKGSFVGFPRTNPDGENGEDDEDEPVVVEEDERVPKGGKKKTKKTMDFVLEKNKEAYRLKAAPKCGHCGEAVGVVVEGKFEGSFYPTEDDGKIHVECYDEYRLGKAPSCIFCSKPVTSVGGEFSGKFYDMDEGKLHAECIDAYEEAQENA